MELAVPESGYSGRLKWRDFGRRGITCPAIRCDFELPRLVVGLGSSKCGAPGEPECVRVPQQAYLFYLGQQLAPGHGGYER